MERTIWNRQSGPDFDPRSFYTFHNDMSPNNTLSSGLQRSAQGAVNMTVAQTFSSSENWQLYLQQGRYFIRNYDYGGDWQLGLTESSRSMPRLLPRSGELGQQWTLTRQSDGTWRFTNGLLGNSSTLGLSQGNTVPGMQPSERGADWDILINPSAGEPKDPQMFVDVKSIEVADTVSSTITPAPTSTPTSIPSASAVPSPSGATLIPTQSQEKSGSLSNGAIAGIAVGVLLLLVVVGLAGYHLWTRRKPKPPEKIYPPSELENTPVRHLMPSVSYKQKVEPVEIG